MFERSARVAACLGAAALSLALAPTASAAEVTLNLISAFPKTHIFTTPLQKFIDEVNQKGKGSVQIRFVGGPEVTPVPEQIGSVQRGINQMYYGSMSYFLGKIPETRSLILSDYNAMELREKGATAILNKYFEKKPELHYLSYFGSGYTFHIYLRKKPKRTPDGDGIDLSGWRIRGGSVYQPVFGIFGASAVPVHTAEIFTALQRGTVDGIGWLNRGLTDFSWEKHIKYRVLPCTGMFSLKTGTVAGLAARLSNMARRDLPGGDDVSIVVQLAKWRSLSKQAQDVLSSVGVKYERIAHEFFQQGAAAELAKLRAAGMKDIALKGDHVAKFREAASKSMWDIVEEKGGKSARQELEAAFTKKKM